MKLVVFLTLALMLGTASLTTAVAQDDEFDGREAARRLAKQLGSSDAPTRRAAAEGLAKLAAVEQKKLVEGYVLQEKDKRVRLALNWALYRMGKSETLYEVVRDLDSSRHDQAAEYLTQLEGPEPLYGFLNRDNTPYKVKLRVIEVLGQIGNRETLVQLQSFSNSDETELATAAKSSSHQIEERLNQPQPEQKGRPRVVSKRDEP